ncbi:MAG: hypothetical protein FJW88_09705 [Actinobacteria bacterium]|nr:hypothetical protein [Actinomycetota bacterium]
MGEVRYRHRIGTREGRRAREGGSRPLGGSRRRSARRDGHPSPHAGACGPAGGAGGVCPLGGGGGRSAVRADGPTGTTVRPRLYVACGVSNALAHRVRTRGAGTVVAINRDPNAVMLQVADFGIVGEVPDVVPRLTDAFRRAAAADRGWCRVSRPRSLQSSRHVGVAE